MLSIHARVAAVVNPDLTQPVFAALLRDAMAARHMGPADLSRETAKVSQGRGIHAGTIASRYRNDNYKKPPEPPIRRLLEAALHVPTYYLEGVGIPLGINGGPTPAPPVSKPPRSAYDPTILKQIYDAALVALERNRKGSVVDYDRARFWLGELYNVAKEILDAPADAARATDEHIKQS